MTLLIALGPAGACAQAPFLLVGDGEGGSIPAGIVAMLHGRPFDTRGVDHVTPDDLASHRVVVWAAGANPSPLFFTSTRTALYRYLGEGGALLLTGDHGIEALAQGAPDGFLHRYLRASFGGEAFAGRLFGPFGDHIGSGLSMEVSGADVETFDLAGRGPGHVSRSIVLETDLGDGGRCVGVRAEPDDWPVWRIVALGFDLARAQGPAAQLLFDRALDWLDAAPRLDFERLVAALEGHPHQAKDDVVDALMHRSMVALLTEPRAPAQLEEVVLATAPAGRPPLAALVHTWTRALRFSRRPLPPAALRLESMLRRTGGTSAPHGAP